jgi:hypothetical protein
MIGQNGTLPSRPYSNVGQTLANRAMGTTALEATHGSKPVMLREKFRYLSPRSFQIVI